MSRSELVMLGTKPTGACHIGQVHNVPHNTQSAVTACFVSQNSATTTFCGGLFHQARAARNSQLLQTDRWKPNETHTRAQLVAHTGHATTAKTAATHLNIFRKRLVDALEHVDGMNSKRRGLHSCFLLVRE